VREKYGKVLYNAPSTENSDIDRRRKVAVPGGELVRIPREIPNLF